MITLQCMAVMVYRFGDLFFRDWRDTKINAPLTLYRCLASRCWGTTGMYCTKVLLLSACTGKTDLMNITWALCPEVLSFNVVKERDVF